MASGGAAVIALGAMAVTAIALTARGASAAPGGGGTGGGGTPSPCGTLDPGIDAATASAVCQAVSSATSQAGCAALLAYAATLRPKWPLAAAVLMARATALGCSSGGAAVPCQPGQSVLAAASSAVESDLAYALATFLNGSGVLKDAAVTPGAVDLSFWVPPGGTGATGGGGGTAPFKLEPGILFTTPAQVAAAGVQASQWIVPSTWPAYMTTQAQDVNTSSAPDGTYYVADSAPEGELFALTKGGGNTTLKAAKDPVDWTKLPGPQYVAPGGAAPSTAEVLLGDMGKFGLAVDGLQRESKLAGFATPAGLPGSVAGVLDAQTVATLAAWLSSKGYTNVLAGTDKGILGAMGGALPGFLATVKADLASCGGATARVAGTSELSGAIQATQDALRSANSAYAQLSSSVSVVVDEFDDDPPSSLTTYNGRWLSVFALFSAAISDALDVLRISGASAPAVQEAAASAIDAIGALKDAAGHGQYAKYTWGNGQSHEWQAIPANFSRPEPAGDGSSYAVAFSTVFNWGQQIANVWRSTNALVGDAITAASSATGGGAGGDPGSVSAQAKALLALSSDQLCSGNYVALILSFQGAVNASGGSVSQTGIYDASTASALAAYGSAPQPCATQSGGGGTGRHRKWSGGTGQFGGKTLGPGGTRSV